MQASHVLRWQIFQRTLILLGMLASLLSLTPSWAASASPKAITNFIVNSINDTADANTGDNLCADTFGECTLRAAIQQAAYIPDGVTIEFAANLTGATISLQLGSIMWAGSNITVDGSDRNITIVLANTGSGCHCSRARPSPLTRVGEGNAFAYPFILQGEGIFPHPYPSLPMGEGI